VKLAGPSFTSLATPLDRLPGAATGAAIGVIGGPVGVVVGGLVGGAAGATSAAVTRPQDVDLGPPPWSHKP